jgi:hypothetical protein
MSELNAAAVPRPHSGRVLADWLRRCWGPVCAASRHHGRSELSEWPKALESEEELHGMSGDNVGRYRKSVHSGWEAAVPWSSVGQTKQPVHPVACHCSPRQTGHTRLRVRPCCKAQKSSEGYLVTVGVLDESNE